MPKRKLNKKGSDSSETSRKRRHREEERRERAESDLDPEESQSAGSGRRESAESDPSAEVQEASPEEIEPYFMAVAHLYANLSKDPDVKVGACIVNKQNQIVGVGYNKMPVGWEEDHGKDNVRHAEDDAIRNKTTPSLEGYRIFITLNPCICCAWLIQESGISEVIYMRSEDRDKYKIAKKMLEDANIKHRHLDEKEVLKVWKERLKIVELA